MLDWGDLHEQFIERDDSRVQGLVGAVIGNLYVMERVKPGKRWLYRCHDSTNHEIRALRGYELVRLAKEASRHGLSVIMPRTPWIDHEEAATGVA